VGQRLDAHMDSATCSHPIPQALQTHTRPLTQAAAYSPRGTPRGWAQPPAKETAHACGTAVSTRGQLTPLAEPHRQSLILIMFIAKTNN
jgi:hypothetical protein